MKIIRYILIIPAFGIVSHIISTYSGRPVFGQIWPKLLRREATNYMREVNEIENLVRYCSIKVGTVVKILISDHNDLQITKACIKGYKSKTRSDQLSKLVGISEAICLLIKITIMSRCFWILETETKGIPKGQGLEGLNQGINKGWRWNQWLAGLIDGDGCFLLSKKGYASLEIVMETRDKHCLYQIKERFGGFVKQKLGVNWLRYRLHHKKGILEIIEAVNGEIRNPERLIQLSKICEKYRIELKEQKKLEYSNGWLSGLIDSDGSVTVNIKSSQLMISIVQKNKLLLDLLPELYGGSVYIQNSTKSFKWVVFRKEEINNLVGYFDLCPLRSEKSKRILLIKRYNELRQLKAHLAADDSIKGKAWLEFKKKWDSYQS